MADGFSFNSIDVDAATYGYLKVESFQPHPSADPVLDLQPYGGGRDGASSQSARLKPLYFTYACIMRGTSAKNLLECRDALAALLDPRNGVKLLVPDWETSLDSAVNRGYYAQRNGPLLFEPKGAKVVRVNINWVVPDGYAVSAAEQSQTSIAIDESPESITVPASGTVIGNDYAEPVWILTNTDSTALSTFTLANTTTSETFVWTGTMAQDDKVKVDTKRCHCEKSTDGGTTYSTSMPGVGTAQVFPRLQGGAANTVTVTGFVAGTLDITYRGRFT